MPKSGFKSITVKEEIYDDLYGTYKKLKPNLPKIGINSFAGFIQFTFEKLIKDPNVFQAFIKSVANDQAEIFNDLMDGKK